MRSVRAFERRPQLAHLIGLFQISDEPFAREVMTRLGVATNEVYEGLLPDRSEEEAARIVRVLDAVLDSSLRGWSAGRSSIGDVRRSVSDAAALLLGADEPVSGGRSAMTPEGAPEPVLAGLRVLDRTSGVAGPYCAKLLVDAGADVVKVEPSGGDPLRHCGSGALFEYLNAGKRSVTTAAALADEADVVLSDEAVHLEELSPRHGAQVTVTITPFGRSGPWVGRPWTEFTLQAACGSTGQRGLPEEPPLAAGGRVGEWAAGTYAAVAALAGVHQVRRTGTGVDVDVAIFDCMAVSLITYPSLFASFTGWPALTGTGRTIQVPSIEPTSDGYFVVTANSAQQFQDLLVMIERPDLLDDPELAQVAKRFARRDEFLATVRAHTRTRTTAEMLEEAGVFRLPAAPVLDPPGVLAFEHFAARGVFEPAASGRFVQPRVPYRITGCAPRSPGRAPGLGEHDGATWTRRPQPTGPDAPAAGAGLPLAGVRVLDCTAWWAGPSATNALAALGADVIKIEATTRPDPMRLTSVRRPPTDEWWEWGPVFHGVNLAKRGVTLDLGSEEGLALFRRMLGAADLLVENFTPASWTSSASTGTRSTPSTRAL